jgi:kynurenine formamidase
MKRMLILLTGIGLILTGQSETPKGWTKGKGYGWVYGKQDELGAIGAISGPAQVLAALKGVRTGRIYDLGVAVDRRSYKWPGHSPTEVMSYRSPEGAKRLKDMPAMTEGRRQIGWHSCALFISDNVGTQIDGLGHITRGVDNHWYNGFKEGEDGHDFGIRKADADSIPPIIAKAVLIDVAGWKGVEALPGNFVIGPKELEETLKWQKTDVQPGDIVLVRTGTLRYWGEAGGDHQKIAEHDSAGIDLDAAKWLVEQKGAVMIASDTSGLEVGTDPKRPGVSIPVHEYLLIEQGVHIGEFHMLEGLAKDRVYRFTYVAMTNRVKGAVAGFAMRPIAID